MEIPQGWLTLRDQLAPFIGERAFSFFALALCDAGGNQSWSEYFRAGLIGSGNDPDNPQVTETEQLLIDWGRRAPGNDVPDDLNRRFESTFHAQLRELLYRGVALARSSDSQPGSDNQPSSDNQ
jgi:hypothetical protein